MAPPVLVLVVSDLRAARDEHIAIDDRATDARVPPHPDARHRDRLIDNDCTRTFGTEDARRDAAPRNDAAGRDDRVERLPAAAAFVGKDELGRRRLQLMGAQRPFRVVEIELGFTWQRSMLAS